MPRYTSERQVRKRCDVNDQMSVNMSTPEQALKDTRKRK